MDHVGMGASESSRGRLVRMVFSAARLAPLVGGAIVSLAGCTAMLESERKQCASQDDCAQLFGANEPYQCSEGVCERPTCASDSECRAIGGLAFENSICNPVSKQCDPPECITVDGCDSGQACNLTTNRCEGRQCTITDDCLNVNTYSPTMACVAGFCVDDSWGCIGKPDDRVRTPGQKGTLVFQLLSASNNEPLASADWDIKVCGPAQYDPLCGDANAAPKGTSTSYNPANGTVTIDGLDPENPVRIWIDDKKSPAPMPGVSPSGVIPMEFITQKPPVGITTAPPVKVVQYEGLLALVESYRNGPGTSLDFNQIVRPNPSPEVTYASLYSVAFDCKDRPAANVAPSFRYLSGNVPIQPLGTEMDPLLIFYFAEDGFAHQSIMSATQTNIKPRLWTFPTGVFSSLNLPAKANLTIKTSLMANERGNIWRDIRDDFSTRLTTGRMTTIHFYPRDYSIKQSQ
jgi:hypothetical protein